MVVDHTELGSGKYIDEELPVEFKADLVLKSSKKFRLKELRQFIVDMVRGEDGSSYESQYPIINEPNVFSISSIAYRIDKQIDWKLGKRDGIYITKKEKENKEKEVNTTMFTGRAIHEFVQKRFVRHDKHWQQEIEVRLHIPYKWKNINKSDIIMLGHCDLVNPVSREIMELKSSNRTDVITHYHELQAGTYSRIITDKVRKLLQKPNFPLFQICVIKIGGELGVNLKRLTEEEVNNAYSDMVQRCLRCAAKLDEQYGLVKQKLGIVGFITHEDIVQYAEIRAHELELVELDHYNASRAKHFQEEDDILAEHLEELPEIDIQLVAEVIAK